MQAYRLTNEPGGLGLSCTPTGVSLAGVPLLQKTRSGLAPRPAAEIASLIKAAYGADMGPARLDSSLRVITEALNRGDVARAMIATVLTRTPELSREAAAKLADAEETLAKYNRDEPRDWHGRWSSDGTASSARLSPQVDEGAASQEGDRAGPRTSHSVQITANGDFSPSPAAVTEPHDDVHGVESRAPTSLEQAFERKYDDLGPVDFAKQVMQFGDRLEREGRNLSPADKNRALAEYTFLQGRLSFWLGYEYTPPTAHGNLLSAAQTLFQGAVNGGFIGPDHIPKSMLYVAGDVAPFSNPPATVRPWRLTVEEAPAGPVVRLEAPKETEGLGGVADNGEVGINWRAGIKDQGDPLERYIEKQRPDARELPPASKTFDEMIDTTGEAISAKTLNSLSVSYIKNPQRIYWRMKRYTDAAADYAPRSESDLSLSKIESKTIHLAVPEYTSPTQWGYLFRAIIYAKERGVSLVITRIRE